MSNLTSQSSLSIWTYVYWDNTSKYVSSCDSHDACLVEWSPSLGLVLSLVFGVWFCLLGLTEMKGSLVSQSLYV